MVNTAYTIMLKVQSVREELKETRLIHLKSGRDIFKLSSKEHKLIDEMIGAIKK